MRLGFEAREVPPPSVERSIRMRVRRPWLLLVLLLLPSAARADDHTAEFYAAGFSFVPGSFLIGPHVAFGKTIELPRYKGFDKNLSIVGDFSTHFGPNEEEGKRVTFAVGGRVSATIRDYFKLVHSGRALVGGVYGTDRPEPETNLAFLFGYEAEWMPGRRTLEYEGWGFRAQVDWVVRKGDAENFARVSTGFVYRWRTD
jgi:hypothetical protein